MVPPPSPCRCRLPCQPAHDATAAALAAPLSAGPAGRTRARHRRARCARPVVAVGLCRRPGQRAAAAAPPAHCRPARSARPAAAPDHRLRQPDRQRQAPGRAAGPPRPRPPACRCACCAPTPTRPRELKDERHLYLVISTQGDGDPPDDARALVEFIAGKRAPQLEAAALRRARPGRFQLSAVLRDRRRSSTRAWPNSARTPAAAARRCRPRHRHGRHALAGAGAGHGQGRAEADRAAGDGHAAAAAAAPRRAHGRDRPFAAEAAAQPAPAVAPAASADRPGQGRAPPRTVAGRLRPALRTRRRARRVADESAGAGRSGAGRRCSSTATRGQPTPDRRCRCATWLARQARTDPAGASVRRQPRRAGAQRRTQSACSRRVNRPRWRALLGRAPGDRPAAAVSGRLERRGAGRRAASADAAAVFDRLQPEAGRRRSRTSPSPMSNTTHGAGTRWGAASHLLAASAEGERAAGVHRAQRALPPARRRRRAT